MRTSHQHVVLPIALALTVSVALAEDPAKRDDSSNSAAVETLRSSLPSTAGFEVDDVRVGEGGVSCITYRVSTDRGGETRAHAVVDGEKVLRSTSRSRSFESAWNDKCAGARSG